MRSRDSCPSNQIRKIWWRDLVGTCDLLPPQLLLLMPLLLVPKASSMPCSFPLVKNARWELLLLVSFGTAAAQAISNYRQHARQDYGPRGGDVSRGFHGLTSLLRAASLLSLCCASMFERRASSPARPSPRFWPFASKDCCFLRALHGRHASGEGVSFRL